MHTALVKMAENIKMHKKCPSYKYLKTIFISSIKLNYNIKNKTTHEICKMKHFKYYL